MFRQGSKGARSMVLDSLRRKLARAALVACALLSVAPAAHALPNGKVLAIPAFARKYGLPCSACHTAWPELNNFGQVFRDNGYQLMNDRDSPIWLNPSYFPITIRITPNWHLENTTNQPIDSLPGGGAGSTTVSRTLQMNGFDLSGMDFWNTGVLFKNISFSILPSSNAAAQFHFENAFVRFDNLGRSSWFNFRFGRFELDNLISEKRFLFLSANGGLYQNYHFAPRGDTNNFGVGDNQLGVELAGHSANSYTRYAIAFLSSNEGVENLGAGSAPIPTIPAVNAGRTYDVYLTFSQTFSAGSQGYERLGAYAYIGERPTYALTAGGVPIIGEGRGNKPFYRAGFAGDLFFLNSKLEFLPYFMHGYDNVYLGTATPSNMALPMGAHAPTWNGGFLESHYYYTPQLVFIGRYELIRMDQQALSTNPSNQSNIDAYSIGYRWYPIMFSRAGLAFHNEYSITKSIGITPLSLDGVAPLALNGKVWSSSVFIGFDFAF